MSLNAVAGWKIFIGNQLEPTLVDFTAASFSAITWVEIDGWEQMGGFGDAAEVIVTALINRGRDTKQKGTRNAGQMTCRFAALMGVTPDAGQTDVKDAEKTAFNYAFKIEANDEPPSGIGPAPTMFMFSGLVTSARYIGGNANTTQMLEANVEINSNIVEVPATTG